MASLQPTALTLTGAVKYFGKNREKRALSGANLTVADGEVVAIVGPSGSGKSTLLEVLGLMLPLDEGELLVRGRRAMELTEAARCRYRNQETGFVFQRPALVPEFSVLENVLLPGRLQGEKSNGAHLPYAKKLILQAGLFGCEGLEPHELSETQQKMAVLVRALVNMPSILLVDEPTAGMDDASAQRARRLIWESHEAFRTTCVIVSNERGVAELADRVIELREGSVYADFRR